MFKKTNILMNICIVFISVGFLFLCLELFVRLNPYFYCEGYRPSKNDRIVYELQPGYQIVSLKAKISSQGLNDRYFYIDKLPGVFRIAVIGDSTSFGWKVGPQNAFPKVLENMLNERQDKKYEVINFSVPGYNTSQELELLKEKVIKFKPDMVILVYYDNDINISSYIKPKMLFSNILYNKSYLVHLLLRRIDLKISHTRFNKIWGLFKKNILGMFYYKQIIYPYPGLEEIIYIDGNLSRSKEMFPERYWYMLGFENYKIHLSNFSNFCEKNNIKFISSGWLNGDPIRINKELGIRYIFNFQDFFSRDRISYDELKLFSNDWHMNIRGHCLCAGYLYSYILTEFR